jgi:hypothetical protein
MFQGYRDSDRWVRWSLERLKTKKKTTKTGESQCLENSPSNNCGAESEADVRNRTRQTIDTTTG